MPKRTGQRFEFETIHLDGESADSQYRQLEDQIRDAVSSGLLLPETRIPSSRALARLLKVSRNTVLAAYQQLISEGYLQAVTGAGTRVASLPQQLPVPARSVTTSEIRDPQQLLSDQGRQLAGFADWIPDGPQAPVPFLPHLPAVDEFPGKVWQRLLHEQSRWTSQHLGHADPQGYGPLREAIADYMRVSRGTQCTAGQVVITSGAQHGVSLICRLLLNPGDVVWVEDPGNLPATQVCRLHRCQVAGVSVDDEGLAVADTEQHPNPRLISVTPGSQWPMGIAMSLQRRLQLVRLAQQHNCWILEDDYNSEYRYTGRPHPTLHTLDSSGRTLFLGTFSKMLFPSIRLGYLIVPSGLARVFRCARWLDDRGSPLLTQQVLHRFIETGEFLKHIRRMKMLYQQRRELLLESVCEGFGEDLLVQPPETGMHLVVQGRTRKLDRRLQAAAVRAGVAFHPVSLYSERAAPPRGMILGFAAWDEAATRAALDRWQAEFRSGAN